MLHALVMRRDKLDVPADGTISMSVLNEEARRSEVDFELVLVIDSAKVTVLKNREGPVGKTTEIEAFMSMLPLS